MKSARIPFLEHFIYLKSIPRLVGVCFLILSSILFIRNDGICQTDLAPGEIMFTGFRSDAPDGFSILLLTSVAANTEIFITDRGWNEGTGAFPGFRDDNNGEGTLRFVFTQNYPCGAEFIFTFVTGSQWNVTDADGVWVGFATVLTSTTESPAQDPNGPELGNTGDQLFIYQNPEPNLTDQSSFVAAIHTDGIWLSNNSTDDESEKPSTGLGDDDVLRFNTADFDNVIYDCYPNIGVASTLQAEITNDIGSGMLKPDATNNWTESDAVLSLTICNFCCNPGGTDFAPGEIMFTGYNSDAPDNFSIVLLTDVLACTEIFITDRGWNEGTGAYPGFRDDTDASGEGTLSFVFSKDFSCGAEFVFHFISGTNWEVRDAYANLVGHANVLTSTTESPSQDINGPELGITGDQLFIYQNPEPNNSNQSSFVTAIQMDGTWVTNNNTDDESEKPSTGLGDDDVVRFNLETDNAKYDCTPAGGTGAGLQDEISNDIGGGFLTPDASNNWNESDAVLDLASTCIFCCGSCQSPSGIMIIASGSFIINMGKTPQTTGNAIKPYGLIYELVNTYSIPIIWSINANKGKDGIDFSHNGRDYRGGPFIIEAQFLNSDVRAAIAVWAAKGVDIDTAVTILNVPVYTKIDFVPNWTLDTDNGSIAQNWLVAAEIPSSAYTFALPPQLDQCDDIFVMPHADPTWANHGNLFQWNQNTKGAIWSGCHAVSALELMFNPANHDQQTNFLSDKTGIAQGAGPYATPANSLILYGNHADGSPPYSSAFPTDPIMQFMGTTDAAHTNGSEQIYLPILNGSWRSTTKISVWDPVHPDIPGLSPGKGAIIAYGRAFGNDNNGYVMYEAGHDIGGTAPANIAAERAFFNFSLLAARDNTFTLTCNDIPEFVQGGDSFEVSVSAMGAGPFTYSWSSTCGGVFANPSAPSTIFTPEAVETNEPCIITCRVTDPCGRVNFCSQSFILLCTLGEFEVSAVPDTICAGQSLTLAVTGLPPTFLHTFPSTGAITINDNGNATPFPKTLTISGLPATGVTVRSITFSGLTHDEPQDMDIYLVGPNNQFIWLTSDAGGVNTITDYTLYFADNGNPISINPFNNGSIYAPGNLGTGDVVPPFTMISTLAQFSGNMNGNWDLYVIDDTNVGNGGTMTGWTITFNEPYSYQWSNGASTPSQVVMPTMTTTYSVTISTGNQCQKIDSVTVLVDTSPPLLTCPPNITIECTDSTDPINTGNASATDNVSPSISIDYNDQVTAGSCIQEGTILRTWTATDTCGNTSACVQIITIEDSQAPFIISCPPSLTIECTASTDPSDTGIAAATDNCDSAPTITYSDMNVPGSCPQENTITRTWIATDSCGNISTCNQIITINDDEAPIIACPPNITLQCTDGMGLEETGIATATDNCDASPTITYSDLIGFELCPLASTITRIWTATDDCGNISNCIQIISIEGDTVAPVIVCPANITIECSSSTAPTNTGIATATDNCDSAPTITYNDVTTGGACPQEMTITRTWVATDNCFRSSSCVQIITIEDSEAPLISCPVNVTIDCSVSTLPANTGSATATDNCATIPIITFVDVVIGGSCAQEMSITRTWTATDGCNNSASCTQLIIVEDMQAPNITCPPDITIACTASTAPANTGSAMASDNCDSSPLITFNDVISGGLCPQEGTITRTWTATDSCGNTATCHQVITIEDNQAPIITCPPHITITCGGSTDPINTGIATATDNCDATPDITFVDLIALEFCPLESSIFRTWMATDDCGNVSSCIQIISIEGDSEPPGIICPPNVTIECTENTTPVQTGLATATDNCDLMPEITYSDMIMGGSCPQEMTITRTWIATDGCLNTSTCTQTIIVDDIQTPILICPPDITIDCSASTLPANTGSATASDDCDGTPTITFSDVATEGSCPQESIITRTWIATDSCGNSSSCIQLITIEDSQSPTITCPPDITIECTASTLPVNTGVATAIDNCDATPNITFTDVSIAGLCPQEMTITRTWVATDACGNIGTPCVQVIVVDDSQAPILTCPANITIECTDNTLPDNTGIASSTDNCDSAPSITYSDFAVAGSCPQEVTITRTWIAIDACGNTSTCNQIINIEDSLPPVITCPNNITLQCTDDIGLEETGIATATDNCDITPGITFIDLVGFELCPVASQITRIWTATDDCGNSSTCFQLITIEGDAQVPVITCPANITIECTDNTLPANTGMATATDNCDITPAINFNDGIISGDCPQEMTIIRTWIALDDCNNSSTCVQMITVADSQAPAIICPSDITIDCSESTIPPNTGIPIATDNCDSTPTITFNDVTIAGACPQEMTINRTWRSSDDCGNSSNMCIQVIIITDGQAPVIICPPDITIACTESTDPIDTGVATATDNCDAAPIITFSDVTMEGTCPDLTTITRTWLVIDGCGNSASCIQNISIADVQPPIIVCPTDVTLECSDDTSPTGPAGMATATDHCGGIVQISSTDVIDQSIECPQEFLITREWVAIDECGNSSTCIQLIFIQDNTPPDIVCPPDVTISCAANTLPIGGNGFANASDNCDPFIFPTFADIIIGGSCPNEFTIMRTWTAEDDCGNSNDCTQTINVIDTDAPEIICPPNLTIDCSDSTDPVDTGNPVAMDCCVIDPLLTPCDTTLIITFSDVIIVGACPQEMTIARTWMAIDDCGNSNTCEQIITVEDSQAPMISCPDDLTLDCTASTTPANTGMATTSDNCDLSPVITFNDVIIEGGCPQEMTITRTWQAMDACGNESICEQTITVDDNQAPMINCPPGITITCGGNTDPANTGFATATDNCDSTPSITFLDLLSLEFCPLERLIFRTWTATDDCGNVSSCVQIITSEGDSELPVVTCPPDLTINCTDSTVPASTGMATATDNCDAMPDITFNDEILAGACPQEMTIRRTWTATDGCLNTDTCIQIITVEDNLAPGLICPPDITIECSESTLPVNTGMATATDDCDPSPGITFSDVIIVGGCPQEMTIIRTWTATDDCGNSITCSASIQVQDNSAPMCSAQNITVSIDPGVGYIVITPADIDNGSSDACGPVLLSITADTFYCADAGENVVTLTVTDECGNLSDCSATVTVNACPDTCITINTWVYLEGSAIDPNGLLTYSLPMRTSLNNLHLLPGQCFIHPFFGTVHYTPPGQPYNIPPWNYSGTEGDNYDSGGNPMNGDAGYPATAVDWVLVSIREDKEEDTAPLCKAAALLHNNGYIDFVEEFDCCGVDLMDSFYIVIEHRNHLIVMSDVLLPIVPGADSSTLTYDFRNQQSFIFDPFMFGGFSGQKEIFTNVFAMLAGNSDQLFSFQSDTDINFDDRTFWESENADAGEYRRADHNLNGDTNFNDRVVWERNNGKFTSVPRN